MDSPSKTKKISHNLNNQLNSKFINSGLISKTIFTE